MSRSKESRLQELRGLSETSSKEGSAPLSEEAQEAVFNKTLGDEDGMQGIKVLKDSG